jgi:hypothetical protein
MIALAIFRNGLIDHGAPLPFLSPGKIAISTAQAKQWQPVIVVVRESRGAVNNYLSGDFTVFVEF